MTTAVRRALTHPTAPAYLALLACAGVAVAGLSQLPVVLLAWTLLGVTAGYSISGSV